MTDLRVTAFFGCLIQAFVINRAPPGLVPWLFLAQTIAPLYDHHTVKWHSRQRLLDALIQGSLHASTLVLPVIAFWINPRTAAGGNLTIAKSLAPLVALALHTFRGTTLSLIVAAIGASCTVISMGGANVVSVPAMLCLVASCVAGVLLGMAQRRSQHGPCWTEMTLISVAALLWTTSHGPVELSRAEVAGLGLHVALSVSVHRSMCQLFESLSRDPVEITAFLSVRRATTVMLEKWISAAPVHQSFAAGVVVASSFFVGRMTAVASPPKRQ